VGPIYLSNVKEQYRQGVTLGQRIDVSRQYLDNAIEQFELNFVLLAAQLWKKLAPSDDERADILNDIAFDKLVKELWKPAEGLSRFVVNDKAVQQQKRVVGQLNWQNRYDETRTEVEGADFSAMELRYQLARLALAERFEEFHELLPRTIESKSLKMAHLDSWPVFRGVRAHDGYKEARAKCDVVPPAGSE
jgi:hypothetical protein